MRRHDAHFTALHVAAETRKQMRAADHAYLTTPATRWQTGGNVAFDVPVVQPEQRAKADASVRGSTPRLGAVASSPPITSGDAQALATCAGSRKACSSEPLQPIAAEKHRLGPLTHQRPGPVDCRADDTPLPGASAVAAVGAPRNATGADAPTSNGGAASMGLAASAAGAPLYALVHYCRAAGLPEPVPEYRFHPTRMWRFDYAFPLHKIAVEVDGAVWTQGRHTRGAGYIADMEKMNAAAKLGWRVLKYTPQTLGVAIDDLRVVLV